MLEELKNNLPETFEDEKSLDDFLAVPYKRTIEMMKSLDGDIMILGVGGKMGPSLAMLAKNAAEAAGVKKKIIGVGTFSGKGIRDLLNASGIETFKCNLMSYEETASLPKVKNIIFMAGRKFGETGSEPLTWMTNAVVPGNVAEIFKKSRIVAFSTGCVYPLAAKESGGCRETDFPAPIGEYANSCLGRERIFDFYSISAKTKVLIYRLNYALDLRYGVLNDIAVKVYNNLPVDISVNNVNFIWQGDANNRALLCFNEADSPAKALNITGKGIYQVKNIAEDFAKIFNTKVTFKGKDLNSAYLSDASESFALFGEPVIDYPEMLKWTARWIMKGGKNLGKPTHFSVTDGQFLDENK